MMKIHIRPFKWMLLSLMLASLIGFQGWSQESQPSIDLNKMLQDQKDHPVPPRSKPAPKPARELEKIEYLQSNFSTSFRGFEGSLGELVDHGQEWAKKMDGDISYRRLCGRFDYFEITKKPQCTPANSTCDFSIRAEKCLFVPRFQSCPDHFVSRFSPDPQHQDFKLCVKEVGGSTGSKSTSPPGAQ